MPDLTPGTYQSATCGTRYAATKHAKTGWHLQKLPTANDPELRPPYQKTDFEAAVNAGIFTLIPETI